MLNRRTILTGLILLVGFGLVGTGLALPTKAGGLKRGRDSPHATLTQKAARSGFRLHKTYTPCSEEPGLVYVGDSTWATPGDWVDRGDGTMFWEECTEVGGG